MLSQDSSLGVTEIQEALELGSPSLVSYHLKKLVDMELVKKNKAGRYSLRREVEIGVLQHFVKVGKMRLPRFAFYAFFFGTATLTYVVLAVPALNPIVLILGLGAAIATSYESWRLWKEKPF